MRPSASVLALTVLVLAPSLLSAEEFPTLDYPNGFLKQPCPNSGPYKKEKLPDNSTEHFYKFTVGWWRAGALYAQGKTPDYIFDANDKSTFNKARTTGLDAYLYYNETTNKYDFIKDSGGTLAPSSIPPEETECHAILMDGVQREVLAVNGQIPGPTIRVNEGDTINVRVCNSMYTKGQAITLHWHGMFQRNTPWMDGVAAVSQPGIFPLQCFTYRFKAEPAGTWWWHSHQGVQYSDGLYGPLIVDRPVELQHHRGYYNHELEDATMLMGDWMHEDTASLVGNFKRQWRDGHPECDPESGNPPMVDCVYQYTQQQDGATMGMVQYISSVINGRGRYRYGSPAQQKAPLTVYGLPTGDLRRFRVVNTGMAYALELSVDDHKLTVIRADGFDIRPRHNKSFPFVVDSLIVGVGERFDLIIAGDQDPSKTYWIRIRTLQDPANSPQMSGTNEGHAVLKYCNFTASDPMDNCTAIIGGALWYPEWEPTTSRKACTPSDTCKVLNCPWIDPQGQYNATTHPNRECWGVGDYVMHCTGNRDDGHCKGVPPPLPPTVEEMRSRTTFTNWGFSNSASANAKKFWIPNATALTNSEQAPMCDMSKPSAEICTQTIRLPGGGPAWFVWMNDALNNGNMVLDSQNYAGYGAPVFEPHPMHMHGHSFYVLKYSYPSNVSRDSTGQVTEAWSQDIDWQVPGATANKNKHNPNFTEAAWAKVMDSSSGFLNMEDPPRKDTIMIPPGGYVVLGIYADNPGWWIIHCHIEPHVAMGMAAVINEWPEKDNELQAAALPKDFPRMASFPSDIDFSGAQDGTTVPCVTRQDSAQCENTFLPFTTAGPVCPSCPAPSCPSTPADPPTCEVCKECPTTRSPSTTIASQGSQSGFMSGTTLQLFAVGSIAMLSLAVLFTQG